MRNFGVIPGIKKRLVLAFIIVMYVSHCIAQDKVIGKRVYLGFGFFSAHAMNFKPGIYDNELFPYKYGVDVKIRVTNCIAFCTGFYLDVMGYSISQVGSFYMSRRNTFFEIPLRFDYRFIDKPLSPVLTFGGYTGIGYKSKTNYNSVGIKERATYYFDIKDGIRSQMYSNFQLGFGLDANVKKFKVQVFPFYDFGFDTNFSDPIFRSRIGGAITVSHCL